MLAAVVERHDPHLAEQWLGARQQLAFADESDSGNVQLRLAAPASR
jgi:hypothetical protein